MNLHLEKNGIRALGIAESFNSRDKFSTLAGVVMRSDLIIDGFGVSKLEVSGSDATTSIISLFKNLERNDINAILLSGSVLSLYNIVDIELLHETVMIPIVALTFKKSESDLARNIRARFDPEAAKAKIRLLRKLGTPQELKLKTGYTIFARSEGLEESLAGRTLDKFTLQGAIPEPVKVARLLAKAVKGRNLILRQELPYFSRS